jgi:hypothetical protein
MKEMKFKWCSVFRESDITLSAPAAGFVSTHPPEFSYMQYPGMSQCPDGVGQGSYITDQFGNARPTWYDPYSNRYDSIKWSTCTVSTYFISMYVTVKGSQKFFLDF